MISNGIIVPPIPIFYSYHIDVGKLPDSASLIILIVIVLVLAGLIVELIKTLKDE